MTTCPYCHRPAELVTGATLFPAHPTLRDKNFWRCDLCDAHVGTHRADIPGVQKGLGDGTVPMGTLANAETRSWRKTLHEEFDALWLPQRLYVGARRVARRPFKDRGQAYVWLAQALSIPQDECHIAMFSVEQCKAAYVAILERKMK